MSTTIGRMLFVAGVLAALPAMVWAQASPPTPPPQVSPTLQARKAIQEARAALVKSKAATDAARAKVEVTFVRANPNYATAKKAYEKAMLDVKTTTQAVRDALLASPDYKATDTAAKAAKAKLATLQADPKSDADEVTKTANEVAEEVTAMKEMELQAVTADPKVVDAKQRAEDAKQQVDDFKPKLEEAARLDPTYQTLVQTMTADEQRVAQGEAALQQAIKADADAAKAKAAAAAASHKSGTTTYPPVGGRGG